MTNITQFGFNFGPAKVERICQHAKHGVWIRIAGKRETVEIRVTKGGRVKVGKQERV